MKKLIELLKTLTHECDIPKDEFSRVNGRSKAGAEEHWNPFSCRLHNSTHIYYIYLIYNSYSLTDMGPVSGDSNLYSSPKFPVISMWKKYIIYRWKQTHPSYKSRKLGRMVRYGRSRLKWYIEVSFTYWNISRELRRYSKETQKKWNKDVLFRRILYRERIHQNKYLTAQKIS